jgi:hypothetical protein
MTLNTTTTHKKYMTLSDDPVIEYLDIDELDVIYLTYQEPQKEEFWIKIKNMVPWATRVDGVKGSDNAHKAAAAASNTERFILIDGDNMLDEAFLDERLTITHKNKDAQFRWRAKNNINGLHYGNGGLSCWTRTFINNMRTHENSLGDKRTNIEFCFDPLYWPMHNCYSTTYPHGSPKQAWIAGFREGVKMCNRDGTMPPSTATFLNHVWPNNQRNLAIWHTVGRDVENGQWAILGARLGTHYLMLREWNYVGVQDFDELDRLWELHRGDDLHVATTVARELNRALGTNIIELDAPGSQFFKQWIAAKWRNTNIMDRETYQ